jgi:hypothetical protein
MFASAETGQRMTGFARACHHDLASIVLPGEIDEDSDSRRGETQTRMTRMWPIVGVPETIRRGLAPYRDVFCRAAGFEPISRSMTGLLRSPNQT